MLRLATIGGDGIGPEVTREAIKVLRAACADTVEIEVSELDYGADRFLRDGVSLPAGEPERLAAAHDAILVGALGDPRVPGNEHARDILLGLRFALDLYVNFRPSRLLDARLCPLKLGDGDAIDIVVFRENTEGLYTGIGGEFKKGTPDEITITECINTRKGVERIMRAAFEFAKTRKARRLCMSDKHNAMRHAHGLWMRVFEQLRLEYPEVESEHLYVDVLAMKLVQRPMDFDVIVTTNLFGDIISDLCAGIVGGLGLAPSANLHPGKTSLFEPVHGSAPDLVGSNKANPLAAIATASLMLRHVASAGPRAVDVADRIDDAITRVFASGKTTPDVGGSLTTAQVGDAVCAALS